MSARLALLLGVLTLAACVPLRSRVPRVDPALLGESGGAAPSGSPRATAWFIEGQLARQRGEFAEAVTALRRAAALDARSAGLQTELARAQVLAGTPDDARASLARALQLDPGYSPAKVVLGQLEMVAQPALARALLLEAASDEELPARSFPALVALLEQIEEVDAALRVLGRWQELGGGEDPALQLRRVQLLEDAGRGQEALRLIEGIAPDAPEHPLSRAQQRLYRELGLAARGARWFEERSDRDVRFVTLAQRLWARAGEEQRAEQLASEPDVRVLRGALERGALRRVRRGMVALPPESETQRLWLEAELAWRAGDVAALHRQGLALLESEQPGRAEQVAERLARLGARDEAIALLSERVPSPTAVWLRCRMLAEDGDRERLTTWGRHQDPMIDAGCASLVPLAEGVEVAALPRAADLLGGRARSGWLVREIAHWLSEHQRRGAAIGWLVDAEREIEAFAAGARSLEGTAAAGLFREAQLELALTRVTRASLLAEDGALDEATPLFESLLEGGGERPEFLNAYAWSLVVAEQRLPEAESLARRALALDPTDAAILDTLGWGLVKQGRTREGLRFLEVAALRAPREGEILWHLAEAWALTGAPERARQMWEQVLSLPGAAPEPGPALRAVVGG